MCDRFPRKFDVQTSYKPSNYVLGANICCENQISSGSVSHDSAFDRRTLLFKLKVGVSHILNNCLTNVLS